MHPITPLPILAWPLKKPRPMSNQRRYPRTTISFTIRNLEDESQYQGINLSAMGLLCTGPELIWPGNRLTLQLLLPNNPVTVYGHVAELIAHPQGIAMRICFSERVNS